MTTRGRRVGIVGAGVAGLACARELAANGFDVTLFDKGRSPGGRTATRRAEPTFAFDHGAQYFTAREQCFRETIADWLARRVVAEWPSRIVRLEGGAVTDISPQRRYVGVPGMSAIAEDLATGLRVQTRSRVVSVHRGTSGWTIATEDHATVGPFDILVVTLPAPQSADLLGIHPFREIAAAFQMTPCWAVMVAFESRIEIPWDGAFVHGSPLSWVARDSSKPGRSSKFDCWVLHASPDWSAAHVDAAQDDAARDLLGEFSLAVAQRLPPHSHLVAHRWRYSHGSDLADRPVLHDPEVGLAMCGDWLSSGRVEGAFLAGIQAAEIITNETRRTNLNALGPQHHDH
jgi:predicted NAD/FAD-dependent oxidoreductase